MNFKPILKCSFFLSLTAQQVYAAGFSLHSQNLDDFATAGAGAPTLSRSASNMYTNPASIGKTEKTSYSINLGQTSVSMKAKDSYAATGINSNTGTAVTGNATGIESTTLMPASAFVIFPKINYLGYEHLNLAIGTYTTDALNTNYTSNFTGRYIADKSQLTNQALALNISFPFLDNPNFLVGGGYSMNFAKSRFAKNAGDTVGSYEMDGRDQVKSYQYGALYQVNPTLRLGGTYYSKVKLNLTGTMTANAAASDAVPSTGSGTSAIPAFPALRFNAPVNTKATAPSHYQVGINYQLLDKANFYASYSHTNWADIGNITFSPTLLTSSIQGQLNGLTTQTAAEITAKAGTLASTFRSIAPIALTLKDSNKYAVGAMLDLTPVLRLNTGVAYDESPMTDKTRTLQLPDSDAWIFALGSTYQIAPNWSLGTAVQYTRHNKVNVSQLSASSKDYYFGNLDRHQVAALLELNTKY